METGLKREIARKILHMAMGFFALTLRWLAPWQAILCALAAIAHNLWLFPHYGMKKLERPEEKERGYSGMIGYPAVVLLLILLSIWGVIPFLVEGTFGRSALFHFLDKDVGGLQVVLGTAAGAWAIMAFGDAFAALGGILLKGPRLPWNNEKHWTGLASFLVTGTTFSFIWIRFVTRMQVSNSGYLLFYLCLIASAAAAIVESLPGQVDDNLTVPLVAWFVLSFLGRVPYMIGNGTPSEFLYKMFSSNNLYGDLLQPTMFILINFLIAGLALKLKWVDINGFLIGGFFGTLVILAMNWRGYCLLLCFYILSHFSTYYGKKKKEKLGIAEEHGGKRLAGSVFSKGFMPAIYAWLSPPAFTACLALYAADTVATEFGKTTKGRTFWLPGFKKVKAGTPGGISLKGFLSGLIAIALMTSASWLFIAKMMTFPEWRDRGIEVYFAVAFAALVLFIGESLINRWNAKRKFFSKVVIHVMVGGFAGIVLEFPRTFMFIVHTWPEGLKLLGINV